MNRRYGILAAASVVVVASTWLVLTRRATPVASPSKSDYVNAAVCADCHQKIAKTYRLTGMGRSFGKPRNAKLIENYQSQNTFYHQPSDRYYAMIARDGRWFQRRHQLGFNGQETNVFEASIDYVIGSGDHARSYLHRTTGGKLVQLPVTWYAEKGGGWAMSPGYDRAEHSDFRRAISYECMSCHNAYPSRVEGRDAVFGADIPEGIDCQRCHGPGRAHADMASTRGATAASIRQAIVNPARLNRDRQMDVCRQCHLQTTSLHSPDSIRRYDRKPFSFTPGEALQDYAVYFEFADGQDRFEIDHAAFRLQKSKCFENSQMTCTTCHNPHEAAQGAQRYEAICKSCHQGAHPASLAISGKACIDCHMPKRRTDDVVHAAMTDHFIQKRSTMKDPLAKKAEIHEPGSGEVRLYSQSPASELYLAVAQAEQRNNPKPGIANLEAALEKYHPREPEFYFELGRAYVKAGDVNKGTQRLEEALRIRDDFLPALKELGAALSDSGQLQRAAEVLERAPSNPETLSDLGGVYAHQGKVEQAEQTLQRAIGVNPELPAAHNLLGLVELRKGDRRRAQSEFREAIRLQPDSADAQTNLGNLLASEGDLKQAMFHFKKATASDPDNQDAHYNLGQALAASGSLSEAASEMQAALRINPQFAKAHLDLARLLAASGKREEARQHLLRATNLDPNLSEAHYYLGQLFASERKLGEAEQQFRLAIKTDPQSYGAEFELGRILAAQGKRAEAKEHFERAARSPDPELRKAAMSFR